MSFCWCLSKSQDSVGCKEARATQAEVQETACNFPLSRNRNQGRGSQCWKQEARTCILGRQSLSDTFLLPTVFWVLLGNSQKSQEPVPGRQLSAGWLWPDFPNLLPSVLEDATSVNTQGKFRDPPSGPSRSRSCFECLTALQSVSAASGLAPGDRWQ